MTAPRYRSGPSSRMLVSSRPGGSARRALSTVTTGRRPEPHSRSLATEASKADRSRPFSTDRLLQRRGGGVQVEARQRLAAKALLRPRGHEAGRGEHRAQLPAAAQRVELGLQGRRPGQHVLLAAFHQQHQRGPLEAESRRPAAAGPRRRGRRTRRGSRACSRSASKESPRTPPAARQDPGGQHLSQGSVPPPRPQPRARRRQDPKRPALGPHRERRPHQVEQRGYREEGVHEQHQPARP